MEDEIGLFRRGYKDPAAGFGRVIGHIFPFVLGEGVVGSGELVHYLYIHFVPFGRYFLEALGFQRGSHDEGCGHGNQ